MSKEPGIREKKKSSSKKDIDKSQGSVKSKKTKDPAPHSTTELLNHDQEKHEKENPQFHFPEQKPGPQSQPDLQDQNKEHHQQTQQTPHHQMHSSQQLSHPQNQIQNQNQQTHNQQPHNQQPNNQQTNNQQTHNQQTGQNQTTMVNHQQNQQNPQQMNPLAQHQMNPLAQQQMNPQASQKFNQGAFQQDEQVSFMRKDDGPKACMHHGQAFAFFCETCEEPICQQCTILGPHNNQLHRINRLQDAYKLRTMKIQEQIKVNLLSKRESLLAQIHRIEYRVEEIKYVKTIIERDARAEYSSILERLRSGEGGKLALLHHEIAELQKDLDQINEVGSMYYDLTGIEDFCPFLLRSRQIYENIEYLVAKPFKINIDVYPYDLPRELTELRLQLQKALAQKQLLDFKNEIIWKVMSDKKKDEDSLKSELEKQAAEEITEWSRLVDKFSQELKKYQMVCYFCACPMDKENVNRKCGLNGAEAEVNKVYTSEQPPSDCVGNERHFFSKPFGE